MFSTPTKEKTELADPPRSVVVPLRNEKLFNRAMVSMIFLVDVCAYTLSSCWKSVCACTSRNLKIYKWKQS